MDVILFAHHFPLLEPVTRKHLALVKALNPDYEVFPVRFDPNRENPGWQWRNCDLLMYEFFERHNPKHDRFFFIEWDTLCTMPLKEFYGTSYDRPVVGACIIQPWSREIVNGVQMARDYEWFKENESAELYPYLRAIMPMCGVMLSRTALFNMVQIWKTSRLFDKLFCEVRVGTLAAMAGYEPEVIRADAPKYLSPGDINYDDGAGIWHRVKR